MSAEPNDPVNPLDEAAADTGDDEPSPGVANLPDNISNDDLSPSHPDNEGVPVTGDPEDPAPGEPLDDDAVGLLAVVEDP